MPKNKIMALLHTGRNEFIEVEVVGPDNDEADKFIIKIPGERKHKKVNMWHLYTELTPGKRQQFKWKGAETAPESDSKADGGMTATGDSTTANETDDGE